MRPPRPYRKTAPPPCRSARSRRREEPGSIHTPARPRRFPLRSPPRLPHRRFPCRFPPRRAALRMRADTGASPRRRAGRTPPKRHSSPKRRNEHDLVRLRRAAVHALRHTAQKRPRRIQKVDHPFFFLREKITAVRPPQFHYIPKKRAFGSVPAIFFAPPHGRKGRAPVRTPAPFLLFYFAFARKPRKVFIRSAALFIRSATLFIRSAAPQRGRALPPPKRGSAPK